jgi:hypothetical protein
MLFFCDSSEKEEVLLTGEDAPDSSEPLSRPARSSLMSFDLSRCKIARASALFDLLCLVWRVELVQWPRRGDHLSMGRREKANVKAIQTGTFPEQL